MGAVSYGGDGRELWEEPIFSDSASCDAHFDSTDLELSIDFCITLSSTTMCHAVLIAEHNSWTLMAKKIDIHIKAIQHAATETALRTGK